MANNKLPSVIILWDLENCFPANLHASDAVAAVRRVAISHGNIKKMKGFWNPNRSENTTTGGVGTFSNNQEYRNALQLQGVDLASCGFLDGENVAKAMLVEIAIDIIDLRFSSPPSIIIISKDLSLGYFGRLLQDRSFTVVLLESWDLVQVSRNQLGSASPSISGSHATGSSTTTPSSLSSPILSNDIPTGLASPPLSLATRDNVVGLANDVTWSVENMDPALVQRFRPLIEILQSSMILGENRVSRANLGNMLTRQSPNVYIEAGVNGFKKYVDLAVAQGAVNVGGGGTGQWVELNTNGSGFASSN